jgi:methylmalonyl-CoA/ethylmalonyl-CoA epimerase
MDFHHIGIFVKNLEFGMIELSKFLKITYVSEQINDADIGVKIIFVKDSSDINYELVAPLGETSPVMGVLRRGKDYLNHIAYKTTDFAVEIEKLRSEGLIPIGPAKKAKAFGGAKVIFFLSSLGFVIELIEEGERHDLC